LLGRKFDIRVVELASRAILALTCTHVEWTLLFARSRREALGVELKLRVRVTTPIAKLALAESDIITALLQARTNWQPPAVHAARGRL
jgi:hypothetical protein